MCIAPSRSLAPPSCKHAVLPPPPFLYSAAGAFLCLVLWLCLRELGPVAASALVTGWLGTALHFAEHVGAKLECSIQIDVEGAADLSQG